MVYFTLDLNSGSVYVHLPNSIEFRNSSNVFLYVHADLLTT